MAQKQKKNSDLNTRLKKYEAELKKAYNQGYNAGVKAYDCIADKKGAHLSAKAGFSDGIGDRVREKKIKTKQSNARKSAKSKT